MGKGFGAGCRREIFSATTVLAATMGLALASATAARADNGVTADRILIGQSASLTGPAAALGAGARDGALAWFQQVNRDGGVHGRKIELVTLDDGFRPDKAAENTRSLIGVDKVFALMGYVGGPPAAVSLPIAAQAKVPFIGPLNGNDALREPFNHYVFNVRAGFNDEIERLVNTMLTIGLNRIAVFHPNDPVGKKALETAAATLRQRNLTPVAKFAYDRVQPEFKAAALSIAANDPQAIIILGPPTVAASFIREVRKVSETVPQFATISAVTAPELVAELGELARGVMIAQVVPVPTAVTMMIVKEYQTAMRAAGHKEFTHASLEGYILARVMTEGLRRAGRQLSREGFIAAMESLRSYDLDGMVITFSPVNHNNEMKFVELTAIGREGKLLR